MEADRNPRFVVIDRAEVGGGILDEGGSSTPIVWLDLWTARHVQDRAKQQARVRLSPEQAEYIAKALLRAAEGVKTS